MLRLASALLFLFTPALLFSQDKPTTGFVDKTFKNADGTTSPYVVFIPKNYDGKKEFPVILFLHGSGERGTDIDKVKVHGPPKLVEKGTDLPMIVISPQCPAGQWWDVDLLAGLIESVISTAAVTSPTRERTTAAPPVRRRAAPISGSVRTSPAQPADRLSSESRIGAMELGMVSPGLCRAELRRDAGAVSASRVFQGNREAMIAIPLPRGQTIHRKHVRGRPAGASYSMKSIKPLRPPGRTMHRYGINAAARVLSLPSQSSFRHHPHRPTGLESQQRPHRWCACPGGPKAPATGKVVEPP